MSDPFIAPLEPRRLLAGVTIITHGYDDNTTGWVLLMANAIARRAGGLGAVSIDTLQIGLNSKKHLAVQNFYADAGSPAYPTASSGETIVKLDWSTVSLGPWTTIQVGDVAAAYLMAEHGTMPALADQPIHLIGHSRGASLNSEIARDLGQHGIWVNHVTNLDPAYNRRDAVDVPYTNTIYAEDYYRTTTSTNNFSGRVIKGTYLLDLPFVESHFAGPTHQGPHTYYFGTIDLAGTSDGWPVYSDWYGHTAAQPARNATGFYYSTIVGGTRPKTGIGAAFGGTAYRAALTTAGPQWASVDEVTLTGHTTFKSGQVVSVHFTHQNASHAHVEVFLDQDRNPFNAGTIHNATNYALTQSGSPTRTAEDLPTEGISSGTYYVGVKITENGFTRYAYAAKTIAIS